MTTRTSQEPIFLQRWLNYALLMRFDKPIGFFLLLWPTLWALWIAGSGYPDTFVTLVFVIGVILMRAAGCIINDYADRNIDIKVSRTQFRPLATGKIKPKQALVLCSVICLLAFVLVLTMNWLTVLLSFVAVLLAIIYPFMKRYTYMPQAFLGLAFGWAVPMAFAAQSGILPQSSWLLLTATVLWTTAYDSMYAMVDKEDDLRIGVKSTVILFGEADTLIIGAIQVMFLLTMVIIGTKLEMSWYYYGGLLAAAGFATYQQYLIRDRDPEQCMKAFQNNTWLGASIFFGIVINYLPSQ
ncbi:MAG: 4-hydroxybenzoate octaprenyltransferase [Gammaproteobacteria bacterium]|nr:4-hydroxybenzoate octaprenyltransferase [Gammaproteobacteria bacterium]